LILAMVLLAPVDGTGRFDVASARADILLEKRLPPTGKAPAQKGTDAAPAQEKSEKKPEEKPFVDQVCETLEREAVRARIPTGFLARLIWQESRFKPNAISPKGAEGIAQFMPGTAKLRGLEDPFDPPSAIAAAAQYLAELKTQFGNLGIAAAAYNAGERRVDRWMSGTSGLPFETRDYVATITGLTAEDWKTGPAETPDFRLDAKTDFQTACRKLPVRSARFELGHDVKSGAWQPWGVQVAANFSRARALNIFARRRSIYRKVVPDQDPMITRELNRSRGRRPLYTIRFGVPSRDAAVKLCQKLRSVGGACMVIRN